MQFDHQPRTRMIFGVVAIDRLGALARQLGGQRVLLVTDRGIVDAGHADRARRSLEHMQLEVAMFDQVNENPTSVDVDRTAAVAKAQKIDLIVGLGGGSSIDTAKGCNFIVTSGGRMQDYCGMGKTTKPMLPMIAIPTTAGTGSEVQSFAIIADETTHQKMACGDPEAAPRIAILDPQLTLTQPPRVTARTGIDAVAHAVETAVTAKRNSLSLMYCREAFRLLCAALPRVLEQPDDLAARTDMLLGAAYAGIAIENSMLGAAHAAANPLTAHFDIAHGQAVGMMLPHVVRFNAQDQATRKSYADLAQVGGLTSGRNDEEGATASLVKYLEDLLDKAQLHLTLEVPHVRHTTLDKLAEEAASQWTAEFNPRPVTTGDFRSLYASVFGEAK